AGDLVGLVDMHLRVDLDMEIDPGQPIAAARADVVDAPDSIDGTCGALDQLSRRDRDIGERKRGLADDDPGSPGEHPGYDNGERNVGPINAEAHRDQTEDHRERDEDIAPGMPGIREQNRAVESPADPSLPGGYGQIHQ